jgi:hypothetical protein
MLKDMFFPLRTLASSFGFTSVTGRPGTENIGGQIPALVGRDHAAAAGKWRGLAAFKCRFTDDSVETSTAFILSSDVQDTGGFKQTSTSAAIAVKSQFRSFFNAPIYADPETTDGNADAVLDDVQAIRYDKPYNTSSALNSGEMFVGRTALNLSTIERDAYNNMPYIPAPIAKAGTTDQPDNPGPNLTQGGTQYLWQSNQDSLRTPGSTGDNLRYADQFTQGIFRIVDGFVELDISNADASTCLVEIVVNSMKKTPEDTTTQTLFNAIHDAVKRKNTAAVSDNIFKLDPAGTTKAGGWQAFYDPEYPLLKVPASTGKNVRSIATEVHRSNHVLAPGQTKTVKIALGSLYYTPESKTEYTSNQTGTVPMKVDNTGSLVFAIGHSGFECFEAIIPDDSRAQGATGYKYPSTSASNGQLSNTGFWAGKTRSPSTIIVRGQYEEKYYPMSFKPRYNTIRRNIAQPSYYTLSGGQRIALPPEAIVANRVATATEDGTRSLAS